MTERLQWFTHPTFGDGVFAMASSEKPCVFCGRLTSIRIHTRPACGGCWEQAGRPAPGTPAAPAAAVPANEPASEPASPTESSRRRARPEPAATFTVDEAEELTDFHHAAQRRVPEATREQAAAALAEWHAALTVEGDPLHFVTNAGRTGIVAFEWLTRRYGAMVMPARLESPRVWELTRSHEVLRVLSWVDPEVSPQLGQQVTETDVHAQYLAAAHSVQCGDGEPDELDATALAGADQTALTRRPGYVRLAAAPDLRSAPAHVRLAYAPAQAGWWLPSPLAAYLVRDHEITLELDAAIVWGERLEHRKKVKAYGPRLSRWAKLFVAGRERLMERAADSAEAALAHTVLKSTYTTFLGGLLRSEQHNDTDTLRPDWNDQVVAQAAANMLRALDKALACGYRTLGGMKDSVWWLGPEAPLAPEGMTFSEQPGKWHITRHGATTQQILDAHAAGNPTFLRKAITQADAARKET